MPASQLPLNLPHVAASAREDLIVSPANALAVELIDSWPAWPGPVVVLAGPAGSGKSHMARVFAQISGAHARPMGKLRQMGDPGGFGPNFVLEDARANAIPEQALFHLLNHVRAVHGFCLITSRQKPSAWGIALPDLASRLRTAQVAELAAPDDSLLSQVLVKLFADRQVEIDAAVVDYLVPRMERSLEAAHKLVALLDREALARNAKVSRSLAGAALKQLGMG